MSEKPIKKANGVHFEGWRSLLLRTEKGSPKALLANAAIALRDAPEWAALLSYDAFRQHSLLRGKAPWSNSTDDRVWTDIDDVRAAMWLQHQGIAVSPDTTSHAVESVAREMTFHPVIDYLKRCVWDGEHRLDDWATTYLGVRPNAYVSAVASRFLISAVARVAQPGCKADCALILEGKQGTLKSTALRTMFHPWFTDELAELGTKDASIQLSGAWGIEIAELDSIKRGDVSRIKAFLSRTTDRYRPPYGRRTVDQPRQCVFAGTVNDNDYLRDDTGGRRFWPIECGRIEIDALIADRDQLWAEAWTMYQLDNPWHLDTALLNDVATVEQEIRRLEDPWQTEITKFVEGQASVIPSEFLSHIGRPLKDQTQLDQNRVVACLKVIGWRKQSLRVDGLATPRKRYAPERPLA